MLTTMTATSGTGSIDDSKKMQQQLELQLHEQYAINNNATLSSMLTLFCTMLAVLWGYGYVLINLSDKNEVFYSPFDSGSVYPINDLVLTTWAATIVLTAISWICIKTGYKGRMEQFIIHAIRLKYYEGKSDLYKILPYNYNPLKKGKCWIRPIQSPYDTFLYIISIVTLLINLCTWCKTPNSFWLLITPLLACILLVLRILWLSCKRYSSRYKEFKKKYKRLEQRYFCKLALSVFCAIFCPFCLLTKGHRGLCD